MGDTAWVRARGAETRDQVGPRNAAFDAWREALTTSVPGDGVRLPNPTDGSAFPDPDGTHQRRAEGVAEAVKRRLNALEDADLTAWRDRFSPLASTALERAANQLSSPASSISDAKSALERVERDFPFTAPAARAALALFDLALEADRRGSAGSWLTRAIQHIQRPAAGPNPAARWASAVNTRRIALDRSLARRTGQDHTLLQAPMQAPGTATPQAGENSQGPANSLLPRPVTTQRVTGLLRSSQEPFGLGLSSGIAFFEDGSATVQGAHGVLSLTPSEDGKNVTVGLMGPPRSQYEELFGIRQPVARAAPSAGGWPSLPATDGRRVALVMGRGEPARSYRDVEIPARGNYLGVCAQGPKVDPLEPLWILRDGLIARNPRGDRRNATNSERDRFGTLIDTFTRDGKPLEAWDLGTGWEFQPGPVMADDTLFVLARGLGGSSEDEVDHADEVRLIALDARTAAPRWSAIVTKERGLLDGSGRGEGGYFATTTMPLTIERTSGTLLVGTNSGLLAAYSVADGRLLWAFRNQRRTVDEGGWPGSRPPLLTPTPTGIAAWFAPFDSGFAYALPAGPAPLDGSLLLEAPRRRGDAIDLAAVLSAPPKVVSSTPGAPTEGLSERSTLVLLGRYGRHSALLVDHAEGLRQPAAYLASDDRFTGIATSNSTGSRLWLAGSTELSGFAAPRDFSLESAAPLASQGAGTGGNAVRRGQFLYILGRDTVWIFSLPGL